MADTFGNVHHYFHASLSNLVPANEPIYYMRTDFYGNILTDTVRLNGFAGIYPHPQAVIALSDGHHSWGVFSERVFPDSLIPGGVYLTERDENGEEVMPPTLVGYGWLDAQNTKAVLNPADMTIHLIGTSFWPCYYSRFTTTAETLQWNRSINGLVDNRGRSTTIIISPADGHAWASMNTHGDPTTSWRVVRFEEDTAQTVFYPLQGQAALCRSNGFGMDANGNADFHIWTDTVLVAYVRLDSTFQSILDYETTLREGD